MRYPIPALAKRMARGLLFPIPRHLSQNHRPVSADGLQVVATSIKNNYRLEGGTELTDTSAVYERDLQAHLHTRLEKDRRRVVPWLDNVRSLRGTRILEIGCGTGASTVALAEQGARVTGIDIDAGAMTVAKDRCRVYGVEVEFQILNAEGIARAFGPDTFDQIIFFACLEHMSVAERLTSLRAAWNILPNGGLLVVVETPNRLWYYDGHTSLLPFFHWLPDELAFSYSAFSPRESFRDLHRRRDASTGEQLLRRGRGVSFHEFDLAIRPAKDLKVLSSLSTFEGIRGRLRTPRLDRRYSSLLRSAYPGIHEGFFDESLYLIIEKQ